MASADAGPPGQINNGINEWMNVTARANFVVPRRRLRAFPLLPGVGDLHV